MDNERKRAIQKHFLESTARAEMDRPSPLFAGRDEQIGSILRSTEILARSPGPRANLSTVIYGAPGSGKSELLAQLRERLGEVETDSPVAVVSGGAELLTDAAALGAAVYERLGSSAKGALRDRFGWDIAGLSLGPVKMRVGPRAGPSPISEKGRLRKVAMDINAGARQPVIVLLIDEAQGKLREARCAPENFVLAFHMGEANLKVLPIYAGLGSTPDELAECDVSRLGTGMEHLLRRLPDRDVAEMADEALNALTGQTPDTVRRWSDAVAEYAQGWPMHTNHALRAVAIKAAPNWLLDDDGFQEAMRDAERDRAKYYEDRLRRASPELRPSMYAAWANMMKDGGPVDERDMTAALGISDEAATALAKKAVKAGLLEFDIDGYVSPIPSLTDHIARRGAAPAPSC